MPRPNSTESLAARRCARLNGQEVIKTPLLVPSFSSKGFSEVAKIIETLKEKITDCALVSAYDSHYGFISRNIAFPAILFIDSGGYECSKDTELSDLGYAEHIPRDWSLDLYRQEISKWKLNVPTVLVSYDRPNDRVDIPSQVKRARAFFRGRKVITELLIKPETGEQRYVKIERVLKHIRDYRYFDILGFTEKELGNNLLRRMVNIAKIRRALTLARLSTPIHIFGSLDTISTPLYFIAGADIFDGLTWLRFAFHNGYSVYVHDAGAAVHGPEVPDWDVKPLIWSANYYALQRLQRNMWNFLNARDWKMFSPHEVLFESVYQSLISELEGGR